MPDINSSSKSKQTPIGLTPKYANLLSGLIALFSALIIFFFFINFKTSSGNHTSIYFEVKPEYASWAWAIFSLSSAIYYFIRSNGQTTAGGYMHPLLKWSLKLLRIFPFVGLILSLVVGAKFITTSPLWANTITTLNNFTNSILILFVVTHFSAGLNSIKIYLANK